MTSWPVSRIASSMRYRPSTASCTTSARSHRPPSSGNDRDRPVRPSGEVRRRTPAIIEKYTRPEMGRIWSEENKYRCWLQVEIAVAEAWAAEGRVPTEALPAIRNATFDLTRIGEIEAETHHDVIA